MCSIKWWHCRWPWVTLNHPKHHNFYILHCLYIFVAGNRTDFKFGMWVEHSKSQPTDDKPSVKWAWSHHVIQFKFQGPQSYPRNNWIRNCQNSYTGTCRLLSSVTKRMTCHPLKGRRYGHVIVFKFCHFPWCSTSRGFVDDSWYLFYRPDATGRMLFLTPNQQCLSTEGNA